MLSVSPIILKRGSRPVEAPLTISTTICEAIEALPPLPQI